MKTPFSTDQHLLWALVGIILISSTVSAEAQADDPNPYYIGVSQAFTHDSNVYRVPEGAQSDTYSSTGLLAGIDQPFGRQRVFANGNIQYNRFNKLDTLNNTSYGLNAGLDWSTIERLSGDVRLSLNETLATYGSTNQLQLTKKNVQDTNQIAGRVQWGLVSLLSLEGKASYQQLKYSAPEYDVYELNQDVVSLGLKYRPSGLLTLGAALRHTRGRYPNVVNSDGSEYAFSRNDIDLTTEWIASGQSTIAGRISFGRQRYNDVSDRDFSGTTGSLRWDYRPTGKLSFSTTLVRDTGTETSFLGTTTGTASTSVNGDNSRLTNSISLTAGYAATGKINVTGAFRYLRRSLVNAVAFANGEQVPSSDGKDYVRSANLGINYAPTRNWLLGCNLGHDSRSVSDGTPLFLSYPYSANTVGCSAQFTLQ